MELIILAGKDLSCCSGIITFIVIIFVIIIVLMGLSSHGLWRIVTGRSKVDYYFKRKQEEENKKLNQQNKQNPNQLHF